MASAGKITARARQVFGVGGLALLLGVTLASAPSGCFLDSSGLGTSGTGGSTASTMSTSSGPSSTTTTGGSGGTTSTSSSASASSSSGGSCTTAAQCGAPGPCDTWACTSGTCVHQTTAEGMPCTTPPGVCDSTGACVGCLVLNMMTLGCTATGDYCYQAACASCTDGMANGDETDQDCGGSHCAACAPGKKCATSTDCLSANCDLGATPPVCVSCSDGLKNGSETDVDCGGTCASKCALGLKCATAADCATGECTGGKCTSCHNGVKDGDETNTDCGGSCAGCANGKLCNLASSCASGFCVGFVCCDAACAGTCQSCNLPSQVGTCTKVPDGENIMPQSGCNSSQVCDNAQACQTLLPLLAVGSVCGINANCFNNNCAGGVCKLFTGDYCGQPGAQPLCTSGTCSPQHKCT